MGKTGEITTGFTGYTYQTMDFGKNSNYTGAGIYCQANITPALSWKGEVGLATAFKDGSNLDLVLRGYGKHKYNDNFNQNIRLQAIGGDENRSFQVRYSPFSYEFDLGKNFSTYGNLYYKGQYNTGHKNNGPHWKNSIGSFAGVTYHAPNNVNFSLEAEHYNLQNLSNNNAKNLGINAIVNVKF